MPSIDEETAGLREDLAKLAESLRNKQEEVRDSADLGKPGTKYVFSIVHSLICFNVCSQWI